MSAVNPDHWAGCDCSQCLFDVATAPYKTGSTAKRDAPTIGDIAKGVAPPASDAPAPPRETMRSIDAEVLRAHWLTGIECNHEQRTDVATCFCAVWRSAPMLSVGSAVDAWIAHVVEEAGK